MIYRAQFPRHFFTELDRLQRDMQQAFLSSSPSIRGLGRGGYPAMNIGHTPGSVEIYVFLPGIDPKGIEVHVEKGVLVIAGERKADVPDESDKSIVHIDERFAGRFRRVVALPDDIDPDRIEARYRDGVLHICIQRRATTQPRQIAIQ
ncbi:Hsp20/alpha crystallin family protein [Pollutimonas bauzanensis]|uniref:HSP20 family protein n=1 Tax=Pollutimonas bauzanensis TaxID=658167 RepID=A0A1M5QW27_9BURK|nr:Hsp20/alpha crystallin family protein [Pollutimonas bauzanensis]SHH17940.1 HSP20 family protein [Pollutimonas bauzanensis]